MSADVLRRAADALRDEGEIGRPHVPLALAVPLASWFESEAEYADFSFDSKADPSEQSDTTLAAIATARAILGRAA